MKPFLRQTLDRQLLRLHELDSLLSATDVVSDLARFRTLTREHAEASVVAGMSPGRASGGRARAGPGTIVAR